MQMLTLPFGTVSTPPGACTIMVPTCQICQIAIKDDMQVANIEASEWAFTGEGNAGIVFAYAGRDDALVGSTTDVRAHKRHMHG